MEFSIQLPALNGAKRGNSGSLVIPERREIGRPDDALTGLVACANLRQNLVFSQFQLAGITGISARIGE